MTFSPAHQYAEAAPLTVRGLQIRAAHLSAGIFAGEYRSAFRGRGIEFDEVREYQPGDDVRSIDWNVTARHGTPFVKRFVEERELTLLIILDSSPSMRFGTRRATKFQVALEATALLAFAALRSNDKVGLLTYSDWVESFLPPGKGKRHVMRLVHQAFAARICKHVSAFPQPHPHPNLPLEGEGTELSSSGLEMALQQLGRVKGKALLFVISDFHDPIPLAPLSKAALRHDVVAVTVSDPAERELPPAGLLTLVDAETGGTYTVDSADNRVRDSYRKMVAARRTQIRQQLASAGTALLGLDTATAPLHQLIRFFRTRSGQRRC